ncbi:MAG: argininosuccinate lyase [Parcubacteria group bacterium]|nr:argininosuccinate lyase [Parcubacteria group bacterium]
MSKKQSNIFWNDGENADFGKYAVEYAAGEDIVLDKELVQYECQVNKAYMSMLAKQGILSQAQVDKIITVLDEIVHKDQQGEFVLDQSLEDVHSNVEKYVIDKLGVEIGGNLRLGMARNDQVYTDLRLYMKDQLVMTVKAAIDTARALTDVAGKHLNTIMPGYTHLRISQPITYAHYLTSKIYHLLDDVDNLQHDFTQVDRCPLGIFEMAGTHLDIDRQYLSDKLGFSGSTGHSLYTANTRGELEAKVISSLSMLALHIRRTMNEVIIFSTHEFGLLEIDDLYATGGTAQPNLKNPDTLEVLRANMAKLPSLYQEAISIMDMLPSGFMRDTQQTKPLIFQAFATMLPGLAMFKGVMVSLKVNKKRLAELAEQNFATAPDMCIQIALKTGVSFREAYKVMKYLIKDGILNESLAELTPVLLLAAGQKVLGKKLVMAQKEIAEIADAKSSVQAHTSQGGPAPTEVKKMLTEIGVKLQECEEWVKKVSNK